MQGSVLMREGHPLGLQGSQGTVCYGSVDIMVSCLPKKAHLYQNFRITRVTTRLLSTIKDTEGTSQVLKRVPQTLLKWECSNQDARAPLGTFTNAMKLDSLPWMHV